MKNTNLSFYYPWISEMYNYLHLLWSLDQKREFQVHSLFETEQKMVFLDIMWEAVECTQLWLMHLLWCKFIYGLKNFQSILLIYFPLFQLSVR